MYTSGGAVLHLPPERVLFEGFRPSVTLFGFFSPRGKLSYGGEARKKNKARDFIPTFPDFTRSGTHFFTFSVRVSISKEATSSQGKVSLLVR